VLKKGDLLDNRRYELDRPLGEGGQGSVWRAIDPLDGGVVRAIKLLEVSGWDAGTVERAWREAETLQRNQHPALVRCYGMFRDPNAGVIGLVFDFVLGQTLGEAKKHMSMSQRYAALEQVATALSHIHQLKLIHRDVKLDNVMVTEAFWSAPRTPGNVKLVDFGIVAHVDNTRPITAPGSIFGTLPYLAPEILDPVTWGRSPGFARDIFAFGVLAWELLRDEHPARLWRDATPADYARVYAEAQAGKVAWPPEDLDGVWGTIGRACLALRPADRPESGEMLLKMLHGGVKPKVAEQRASSAAISSRTLTHSVPVLPTGSTDPMSARRASTHTPIPMSAATPSARTAQVQPISAALYGAGPVNTPIPMSAAPRSAHTAPVYSNTGAGYPRPAAPNAPTYTPPPSKRQGSRLGTALALMGGAALFILIGVQAKSFLEQSSSDLPPAIPLPISTASPTPVVTPSTCESPCCGGSDCSADAQSVQDSICERQPGKCSVCKSQRTCVTGLCREPLSPHEGFLLRFARVTATDGSRDLPQTSRDRICMAHAGAADWTCVRLANGADIPTADAADSMKHRLPITTSDILPGRGVDIWLNIGSSTVKERVAIRDPELKRSSLCVGVQMPVPTEPLMLYFYLDDP